MTRMPKPPQLLTAEGMMTGEKLRGAASSLVSGAASAAGVAFGTVALGMSAPLSVLVFTYVLGGLLGYSLDIMVAKRDFGTEGVPLPYADLAARGKWLLRSFGRRYFFRFVVTIIIETLTTLAMIGAVLRSMDAHRLLTDWPLRDAAVALTTAFVNFWLFGNVLRFDWAYREVENPVLNVVVLLWMALSALVFASTWMPFRDGGKPSIANEASGGGDRGRGWLI